MESNGWLLLQHPLFQKQFDELLAQVEKLREESPDSYHQHTSAKLLKRITSLIIEEIPSDPSHDRFNQGNTLGKEYRHWKRAKFGRYRLFFRYHRKQYKDKELKVIVYAWVNDESTLRKEGDKNDPYSLFSKGLRTGQPPDSIEDLIKTSCDFSL